MLPKDPHYRAFNVCSPEEIAGHNQVAGKAASGIGLGYRFDNAYPG
jgi:hypothetical protein